MMTSQQTIFNVFADTFIDDFANRSGYLLGSRRPEIATTVIAIINPRFSIDPKNISEGMVSSAIELIINGMVSAQWGVPHLLLTFPSHDGKIPSDDMIISPREIIE